MLDILLEISQFTSSYSGEVTLTKQANERSFGFTIFGGNHIGIFIEQVDTQALSVRPEELPVGARVVSVSFFIHKDQWLSGILEARFRGGGGLGGTFPFWSLTFPYSTDYFTDIAPGNL